MSTNVDRYFSFFFLDSTMPFNNSSHELKFNPMEDGVTHINIYSRGDTELGRMLSHFYNASIDHPEFGSFANMECFWHYLSRGCKHEKLRNMPAFKVKQLSKELPKVVRDDFMEQIKIANELKILQHPNIMHVLCDSSLPFEHYYTFGSPPIVRRPNEAQKLIDIMESIRTKFKETKPWLTHSLHLPLSQVPQTN